MRKAFAIFLVVFFSSIMVMGEEVKAQNPCKSNCTDQYVAPRPDWNECQKNVEILDQIEKTLGLQGSHGEVKLIFGDLSLSMDKRYVRVTSRDKRIAYRMVGDRQTGRIEEAVLLLQGEQVMPYRLLSDGNAVGIKNELLWQAHFTEAIRIFSKKIAR